MLSWRYVFFVKQKTAYKMRMSDWRSDVGSSDLLGYESVRVKPGAEQITRAESLYQRINQGKPAIPRSDKWLPILQDWLPFILVSQLSFVVGAFLNSSWGFALAAALSVPLGLDRKSTRLNSSH